MVFPVVMFGCESCTIKRAEQWRIDAFELWCWRRLLRVLWTARTSNQSILKEISPGCSSEGLMLKLKLQYFGYLKQRADTFEKTLMLGKIEGRKRRGLQRMRWLDGITDTMDMGLGGRRSWWWTGRPGVLQFMGSQRVGHDWATELNWTEYTALMYSFPNLEPVHCSKSGSNCCFLTCIQISQEADKVVWYFHLFKNSPQFLVIHTVKGFGVVNKAGVDVFLELSCFFDDPMDVGNLISGSSAFSKSSLNIWKFLVHILLKPSLKNFEHYFASVWNECNCAVVWAFFGISFLWDWNENWPFPVLWPLLSFPNLLGYWVQHFHSIIFQDLK